jgi:lipopolysaccharide/colanic/teichoic acid biosynthesis glycosyltransferase
MDDTEKRFFQSSRTIFRNALSWEEKFKLDVWYVNHMSFGLDLKIIALTLIPLQNHDPKKKDGERQAASGMAEIIG